MRVGEGEVYCSRHMGAGAGEAGVGAGNVEEGEA